MSTSALDYLRCLPEVFSLNYLAARMDGDKAKASVYLSRWKLSGLVSSFGQRTGVHFNLLRNPNAPQDGIFNALEMVFPGAVIIGASVLHDAAWTTQIPRAIDVAVLNRRSFPVIAGFDIHCRPREWFALMRSGIDFSGYPKLKPAYALADAFMYPGLWQPDIDDLEEDEVDWPACRSVFGQVNVDWPVQYPDAPAAREKLAARRGHFSPG